MFSVRALNVLVIIILNFLCGNSNIYVMSESSSDPCFVSSDCFSFPVSMPCNFFVERCWVIETEVHRLFMWYFMLICQGVGLCLTFAVAAGANDFESSVSLFLSSCWLWSTPFAGRVCVLQLFQLQSVIYNGDLCIWSLGLWGQKHSIILWLNSRFLVGLCLKAVTFTSVSYPLSFP